VGHHQPRPYDMPHLGKNGVMVTRLEWICIRCRRTAISPRRYTCFINGAEHPAHGGCTAWSTHMYPSRRKALAALEKRDATYVARSPEEQLVFAKVIAEAHALLSVPPPTDLEPHVRMLPFRHLNLQAYREKCFATTLAALPGLKATSSTTNRREGHHQ
jgi:hypothetical protein